MRFLIIAFFLFFHSAYSHSSDQFEKYGSWEVKSFDLDASLLVLANTANADGSVLGFMCLSSSGDCALYLINGLTCRSEGKYPMLINLGNGIHSESLECSIIEDRHLYLFPDAYTNEVLSSESIGIAYGTASGQFKASYFDLNGSAKALIAAGKMIENYNSKSPKTKSKQSGDVYL